MEIGEINRKYHDRILPTSPTSPSSSDQQQNQNSKQYSQHQQNKSKDDPERKTSPGIGMFVDYLA